MQFEFHVLDLSLTPSLASLTFPAPTLELRWYQIVISTGRGRVDSWKWFWSTGIAVAASLFSYHGGGKESGP